MPDASAVVPNTTPASAPTPLAQATAAVPPTDGQTPPAQAQSQPPAAHYQQVPTRYELKLPQGSLLDQGRVDKIVSFAKERGLSNEVAQSLLEQESDAVSGYLEAQTKNYETIVDTWAKAAESDSEIGGANFQNNLQVANSVIKRFGSDALVKALKETGYGNHPELVRVFARIGKAMSPDKLVLPGAQPAAPKAIEDMFYGSKSKEN